MFLRSVRRIAPTEIQIYLHDPVSSQPQMFHQLIYYPQIYYPKFLLSQIMLKLKLEKF